MVLQNVFFCVRLIAAKRSARSTLRHATSRFLRSFSQRKGGSLARTFRNTHVSLEPRTRVAKTVIGVTLLAWFDSYLTDKVNI